MKINKKDFFGRMIVCIIGILFISLGVALAKIASLGNDPCNGMWMSVSKFLGISYPVFAWGMNLLMFTVEIIWGRRYINIGTFLNWLLVSFAADYMLKAYDLLLSRPDNLLIRVPMLAAGIVVCSLGIALYQVADLGVAPYDALSLIASERIKKLPYFWARIIEDSACVGIILLTYKSEDHLLGVGTVLFAFCLGPIIFAFTKMLMKSKIKKANKKAAKE